MKSTVLTPPAPAAHPPQIAKAKTNYLTADFGWKSWLFTVDHKRIAVLYLVSIMVFFLIGGTFAILMRGELLTPKGDLFDADTYNKLFTMHGVVMIFFFLIPSIPAVLGNFLVPIMIGTKDLAFPKINLLSWYIYLVGGGATLYVAISGGIDTGWTFYAPYSSTYANTNVAGAAIAVFVTGFSSILTGLNFIVTIHKMRAPGMTWFRMPLFLWAQYATSLIMIMGTPVLAITVLLLALERTFHIGIFDPALGGDPVLFQHLFWFYSHPAVYIMILPGMGVVSEIVACFSKKPMFGYHFIAFSSLAIAIFGFVVWGHHMFVSGQSAYAGFVFSFLTMLVAIPSAVKVFNWIATLYKGQVSLETPMLYALGFIGLFTIGGVTGLFLAVMGLDRHVHDTYFVVAHFHYVMVGGMVMAFMGGMHFWWSKMFGRMYPEAMAQFAAVVIFVGFNFTFFPQFILGYMGMPRRYHQYNVEFQTLNVLSSAGASILGMGFLMTIAYFVWSLKWGKPAPQNPFGAKGLEWERAPSPPPTYNFEEGDKIIVTEDAYAYTSEEPAVIAAHEVKK
ncbi:MAG TPA: cytochrome c oxidase subunit I [Planctomycetota bacterium]|nr:cytochrome c oxidase subunit I [Planctomycetota bacterium]